MIANYFNKEEVKAVIHNFFDGYGTIDDGVIERELLEYIDFYASGKEDYIFPEKEYIDSSKHSLLAYTNIYARAIMNKTHGDSLRELKEKDKGRKLQKIHDLLKEARMLVQEIEEGDETNE